MRSILTQMLSLSIVGFLFASATSFAAETIVIPDYLARREGNIRDTAPLGTRSPEIFQTAMGNDLLGELNIGDSN